MKEATRAEEHGTLRVFPDDEEIVDAAGPTLVAIWEGIRREFPLQLGAEIVVGRGTECNVHVHDAGVSRKHAVILGGTPPTVRDLGSANGTCLDGVKIPPEVKVPLETGSVVEVGPALFYVRALPEGTSTAISFGTEGPGSCGQASEGALSPMVAVYQAVAVAAPSNISVIIFGETGVGKDVIAEALYASSGRARKPFIRLNCAALPDALLESELFGYEVGAFSGAHHTKHGLLEVANGGTFFFDEIGELPVALQAKLLRVLETGEVTRLGGVKPHHIDVRILAATNRDLRVAIAEKRFREDLYFRLEGFSIYVPPLRERVVEIQGLAETFVRNACQAGQRALLPISAEALALLKAYAWPGNVRQLKNAMERAVLLCSGSSIEPGHLSLDTAPPSAPTAGTQAPPLDSVAPDSQRSRDSRRAYLGKAHEVERQAILDALAEAAGNQSRAARLLGISRGTLLRRLNDYGLPRPRRKGEPELES